jgi:DNA-binding NarL/FixJ family response regulator
MRIKIKIAIADDHPLVISGLKMILKNNADMELVGSYSNGRELLAGLTHKMPEVLVLDIHMPGMAGDELVQIVRTQYPDIKILALTNEDNLFYIKTMLRKGVHGYMLKTTSEHILINAIRILHSGQPYLETSLQEKVKQDTLQAKKQM